MVNSFFKYKIMDLSTTLIKPFVVFSVLHKTLKKSAQIRQPIPKKLMTCGRCLAFVS